jgi:hypothetical protein
MTVAPGVIAIVESSKGQRAPCRQVAAGCSQLQPVALDARIG